MFDGGDFERSVLEESLPSIFPSSFLYCSRLGSWCCFLMWINIHLPSGRFTSLWAARNSCIGDLRAAAGQKLGVCVSSLITGTGQLLQPSALVEDALKDGDALTAVVQSCKVASCDSAFALVKTDGRVVTLGGKRDWVRARQLQNVQEAGLKWLGFNVFVVIVQQDPGTPLKTMSFDFIFPGLPFVENILSFGLPRSNPLGRPLQS